MRLERKALRKFVIETLLKEAFDKKSSRSKKVVSEVKGANADGDKSQNVQDKSGNNFSISPEGEISLIKDSQKITFEGEQKRKVASNLIDDLKSMDKAIPTGLTKIIPNIDYEIVDEANYRFKIFPSGQLFLLSKSGKLINREITGQNKSKAAKVLQDLVKDKQSSYPYLFKISTTSATQADAGSLPGAGKTSKKGVQYFPGYDGKILTSIAVTIEPKKEANMVVGACKTDGCAQFVRETLGPHVGNYVGNAWHAHGRFAQKSAFNSLTSEQTAKAAKLFSVINAKPQEKAFEKEVKAFVSDLIPDQSQFSDLSLGDVVGLYYNTSDNFTKAFFEGATGHQSMGKDSKVSSGPFFLTSQGDPWTPGLLGKKIPFQPGRTLSSGGGFGMNTHVGFVGALVDGVPIIYHNIHHTVYATGLEAMSKNGLAIVWAGRLT